MTKKTLLECQQIFVDDVSYLIGFAINKGYQLTFGEAYRTPEQALLNVKNGTGIANSLHCKRLAIDFNIFKDGLWITDSAKLIELGTYWKSLGHNNTWGGDFKDHPDGNHFSQSYGGIK